MIDLLSGIQSTAAALDAERTRLDVISENVANANTTHGPDGKPYQRQVVVFESALQQAINGQSVPTLRVAGIEKDPRPFEMVYEPGNPDADARGLVAMPNVNIHEEMADMISASRTYEANLAVIKNARAMALQVLSIGKH
ncbi:MAG TPA: flagellar basal body rod protein FlgC [Verrucomicrobiae bacterium]|nr:flagellar basal body rod protein FlgC [Verrucomicrobiae bacterium]